jgi:hypothetical protein
MNNCGLKEYYLRQLFEQVIKVSKEIETFTVKELWEWTKFDNINSHLNNSLVLHEFSGAPVKNRKEALADQSIKGDFLLFEFVEHLPEYSIRQCADFEELIDTVFSHGGILNPFTTLQIPIIKGVAKDILFILKYTDKTTFGQEFEKETIENIKNETIKICQE